MPSRSLRAALPAAALCLATVLSAPPALAAKVMELEADQLIRAAGYLRESLTLTPNQQILFQQVNGKSAAIMRARQSRRERLQADLKTRLADPGQELRALGADIDQEAATSAAEERELRALWLTLGDALTDQQRSIATGFLITQLERVDAPQPERAHQGERGQGERGPAAGGGKGRHGGGPGGAN